MVIGSRAIRLIGGIVTYWSGKLTKLLGNGKAKIELVPPPLGEGSTYEVFVKDLRPSLDWSPKFGWAVPVSLDGECCRQCAKLLQPVSQGHAMGEGRHDSQATTGSSSSASFSTRLSNNSLLNESRDLKNTELVERPSSIAVLKVVENRSEDTLNRTSSDVSSSNHIFAKSLPALNEKRGSESKKLEEQISSIVDSKEAQNTSKESIWSGSDSGSPIGDDAAKSVGLLV